VNSHCELKIGINTMKPKLKRRYPASRQGAAVVEFAVCLPVLILIVLGSIEAASMLFLRQALIQSAYEGAKVAIRDDGNNSDAINAIDNVAAGRRINEVEIAFSPENVSKAKPGEFVSVTITAPGDSNSFIPFGPFKNRTVSARAVMVKE
jgi:Flp pilus assembly protein TadG